MDATPQCFGSQTPTAAETVPWRDFVSVQNPSNFAQAPVAQKALPKTGLGPAAKASLLPLDIAPKGDSFWLAGAGT